VRVADGSVLESCVLVPTSGPAVDGDTPRLTHAENLALVTLAQAGPSASGAWRANVSMRRGVADVPVKTFDNWRKALINKGLVVRDPATRTYAVTTAGATLSMGSLVEKKEDDTIPLHASHATPPIGVAGRREESKQIRPTGGWEIYVAQDAGIRGEL
jgi:hypothetical protein